MDAVAHERRRDGTCAWGLYEDTATPNQLVETFFVASWIEHVRHHQRVTKTDEAVQDRTHRYLVEAPVTTHLVSAGALDHTQEKS